MIDLHCHILPGLDDGADSLQVALEMCRVAVGDGIRTIVATPHMLNGMFEISPDAIRNGVRDLQDALVKEGIGLRILPGADVHVDRQLPGLLDKGMVLTVADQGRHLMLELPQDVFPAELKELVFRIQLKGITPLISHPERNVGFQQNPTLLAELIQAGSLTQITAGSIAGWFGTHVQACALRMLRQNMVHVVATDAHNTTRRAPRLSEARAIVLRERGEEEARLLFSERPEKILAGVYVEPPEPAMAEPGGKRTKGFFGRLFSR